MPIASYEPGWAIPALKQRHGAYPNDFWFDESGEFAASDLKPYLNVVDDAVANMKRAADSFTIRQPVKWSTGISQRQWLDTTENYGVPTRIVLGIDPAALNERSKPMGLTKSHFYKSTETERVLSIEASAMDPSAPHVHIKSKSDGVDIWLNYADTIPLALNVLGYDRPSAELHAAGPTEYSGHVANKPTPTTQSKRDANIAKAIDLLRGADIFDQRTAANEAAEAESAAKANRIEELRQVRNEANEALHAAARNLGDVGIYHASLDGLTAAIEARNRAQDALDALVDY